MGLPLGPFGTSVDFLFMIFFMGLPLGPLGTSFDLSTPPAAAFIPYNVSVPYFFTASLVNTNSPGVNIAGTVSLSPWPGTSPP